MPGEHRSVDDTPTPEWSPPSDRILEDEIRLGDYLRPLVRHRLIVLAGMVAGGVIGIALASAGPTLYEGTATLMVLAPTRGEAPASIPTYRALIENVSLAAEIVEELGLNRSPHTFAPQAFLERAVTVNASAPDSRFPVILRVGVRLREPSLAMDAARRLAEGAMALNERIALQDRVARSEELQVHLDAARDRLLRAETDLLAFQQEAQLDLLRRDAAVLLDDREALLKLLVRIESEKSWLVAAEDELRRYEPLTPAPRAGTLEHVFRRSLGEEDVTELSHPFVNPVYQTLQFQIATRRTQLASLEAERRQLMDVRKVGGPEIEQITRQYARELELARRESSYEIARSIHKDLVLQIEQAPMQALGTGVQLQVVDWGTIPAQPLSHGRMRWMVLGVFSGLFIAMVGVFVLHATGRQFGGAR